MTTPDVTLASQLRALADRHDQDDTLTDERLAHASFIGLASWTRNQLRAWAEQAEQLEQATARVRAVLDHSAKVSPSAAMTVYAAEIRAALDTPPPS